ncbi:MAG: penicillin-binding protein 2 [Flavobacteriales bacterium Tduv]
MNKLRVFYGILILVGLIMIMRLAYLQLLSQEYIFNAFNISIKKEVITPERGYIFDRNEQLLVYNQPIYELIVTPVYVDENLNVEAFCRLIGIDKYTFNKKLAKAKAYSKYLPSTFLSYISKEKFALIQEKLYRYKGFDSIKHSLRAYNVESAANILGYIGEVGPKQIKKDPGYYQIGTFVGWAGVEKSYEKVLRGKKGIKYWMRDRMGCVIGPYNNLESNIKALRGDNISLTIDWELQDYAERLMYKKKGAIIAIDPKTGEILALISSPVLDPNLFVGKDSSKEISKLLKDTIDNPLFDRATQGLYPPGSPFKVLTELAGLQMGVVDTNTTFICQHGFRYGQKKINCHCGIYGIPMDIETAVARSCNNYFAQVYRKMIEKYPKNLTKGVDEWSEIIKSFGLGGYLENDLATGHKGRIPTGAYYNKKYSKRWNALTIISNSIGQGEIDVTPIQLANMTAAIANRGFFYTPHILKAINRNAISNSNYTEPKYTKVSPEHFEPVIRGMEKVFLIGTGRGSKASNISMAGKTGTAQNFIKVNGKAVALEDHSIFTLFAPVENPKIAIAVMIENGGFGARWAGPIASLIAERHITKTVQRTRLEQRMMTSGLQGVYNYISALKRANHKNILDEKKK